MSKKKKHFKYKTFFLFILITLLIIVLYLNGRLLFRYLIQPKLKVNLGASSESKIVNPEVSEVSLVMVGDCLIHGSIYDDAKNKVTGDYNFYKMISNIKPVISKYDLAFYNQESILGGTSLGLSTYPTFNSPQEVGDAFLDAGFNLVSLANNHTLDRGKKGIRSSLAYWKTKTNVMTAGSYESEIDRTTPRIMEKNGIKYTLLSYTTTTNGITQPKDEPYLVNVYSPELVKTDVERVKGKVDVILVAMHWGEEYTHTPNSEQREIAKYLSSLGVNIVIGHHPHVIQPIEFIGDTMVIYSLGNFIASQYGIEKLTGLVASVTIKKSTASGITTITLENPTVDLSYVYSVKTSYRYGYKMYMYSQLNNTLLKGYKDYYKKYTGIAISMSDKLKVKGL